MKEMLIQDDTVQRSWMDVWNAYIQSGKERRKQIAELLDGDPSMSAAELGKRVGCSRSAAHRHKRSLQQLKG